MNITECLVCQGRWNDTDDTGVCPQGHESRADDNETEHQEHLRGLTW